MTKENILREMRDCVGFKEPIGFFRKMVDVFNFIFEDLDKLNKVIPYKLDELETKIRQLESALVQIRTQSALSIQWEPKVASEMIAKQIEILRQDKETYHQEITKLKSAYTEGRVTQNYYDFCRFWQDVLGWHPFLE